MSLFDINDQVTLQNIKVSHTIKRLDYLPDSITRGTPGRDGEVKVYFNADDVDGSIKRIDRAMKLREHFNKLYNQPKEI